MPVLNWIGKDKVVNHDKELPFRVLKPVKELSIGENSENLLIEGDNLEALKALMPFYYGQIKCIYIDPPYNTGNEKWIFNDKVNSPQIKSWLNKVVGAEGEDLCRHDKWLCMMYPRLKLLRELLTDDGVLFISIDEYEIGHLNILINEIFGDNNTDLLVWRKTGKQSNTKEIRRVKTTHEYVVVAYKDKKISRFSKVKLFPNWKGEKKNPDNDHRGKWESGIISNHEDKSDPSSPNYYSITLPSGRIMTREFYFDKATFDKYLSQNKIYFPKNGDGVPRLKIFEGEEQEYYLDSIMDEMGTFSNAKDELENIFGNRDTFDTPKPSKLIKELIRCSTEKDDIVLDSFAGTGTTGQAVLELNKEDGMNRKCILVEIESEIAKKLTIKRLEKTINGFENAKYPKGTGQGFEYLELNGELYDTTGFVNLNAQYEDMAAYIYFTETKKYLDIKSIKKPYIGSQSSINYFLFFEGQGNNILDEKTLIKTDSYKGRKVIYADKCLIDEEHLEKLGVIFKQIPYELKKY